MKKNKTTLKCRATTFAYIFAIGVLAFVGIFVPMVNECFMEGLTETINKWMKKLK